MSRPRGRPSGSGGIAGALLVLASSIARPAVGADREGIGSVGSPPLIVHAAPDRMRVAADLAARGPAEIARIAETLGLRPPERIDAWLLPRQGTQTPESHGLPGGPPWAAGLALERRPIVILRTDVDRGASGNEVLTTLSHELVHAVMADALGPRVAELPAWWKEGLAAHLAGEWRLVEAVHVVGLATSGRFLPLREIAHEWPRAGPAVQAAYLESFAFVRWLAAREGDASFRAVFERMASGATFREAFRGAFGGSPEELEEEWKAEFLWRYRWLPIITSSSTLWTVTVVLFVLVGLGKRREARRRLEALEDGAPAGTSPDASPDAGAGTT